MAKAFITGVTGQDGSYLAEMLLNRGYEVHALMRRSCIVTTERIRGSLGKIHLHYGDVTDGLRMIQLIGEIEPDEIYNLAAQSDVRISFDTPIETYHSIATGGINILEAVKLLGLGAKIYQAVSSEMFGQESAPQAEDTKMAPVSPYACAKVFLRNIGTHYRTSYDMFVANGILFNHESPRRGINFVTRKITKAAAMIYSGFQETLYLGNLHAKRDWGYAPEYCISKEVPILSTEGWKYFDDVKIGDEIINFDPKLNALSRDRVNDKINLRGNGAWYIFKGRGFYLRCTADHRIYYKRKSKNRKGFSNEWEEMSAKDFHKRLSSMSVRSKYDYAMPHFQGYDCPDYDLTDSQIYLLGVLLAEGYMRKPDAGRGLEISVSQSFVVNEAIHDKIEQLITDLGLKASRQIKNCGVSEWKFSSESSVWILDNLFEHLNIHIAPRFIYKFSQRQAEILLNALMDCDGHWGSFTYFSKRSLLAVDFQSIAHLAGYRTTKLVQTESGFRSTVVSRRKKYSYIQESEVELCSETDLWCVSTSNGTIITRDNGCISVSGNCDAMTKMLQHDTPDDFVIATGKEHSVEEFLHEVFSLAELDVGKHVKIDPNLYRATEVPCLRGDATKAHKDLGWKADVSFKELAKIMYEADLADMREM